VEDVASAKYVYEKALKARVGTAVEFGGERFDANVESGSKTPRNGAARSKTLKKKVLKKRRARAR